NKIDANEINYDIVFGTDNRDKVKANSRARSKMSGILLRHNPIKCDLTRFAGLPATCIRTKFSRSDTPKPDRELLKRRLFYVGEKPSRSDLRAFSRTNKTKMKTHPERPRYPNEYTNPMPKGKVYEKFPFKMTLEAEKSYSWCTCGLSHKQPFCDGSHKVMDGTTFKKYNTKFRPHRFTVEETKEYYMCNCKQTDNRPFCDGAHKKLLEQVEAEGEGDEGEIGEEDLEEEGEETETGESKKD
ncbi:hypothetical protein LSH36_961g00065, partial [Paralvinella palmiformis]